MRGKREVHRKGAMEEGKMACMVLRGPWKVLEDAGDRKGIGERRK